MSSSPAERESPSQDRSNFSIVLRIESRFDQIHLIRAALSGVLGHLEIVESDIHSLGLAVTEIINNSLEHGYKGAEDKQIEVRIQVFGLEVRLDIIDHAPPFPDSERYRFVDELIPIEDPSDEWAMRGHGLQIVRKIVDSISLRSNFGRNCITLTKHVSISDK
jgi:anti-sigma regulatory factor (Ser/Thr protein kinase)